jgi:hypothetical protein
VRTSRSSGQQAESRPAYTCWCTPAEAIVRGHKSGLLTMPDYNNLTQCEALDDIKLNLVRQLLVPLGWLSCSTGRGP